MIPAQQAVELALQAAERSGRCDETIVIVTDRAEASLRWAGNSMTTNGVSTTRSTAVIAVVYRGARPTSAPSDRATWIRLRWLPRSNPPRMRRSELRPLGTAPHC